MVEVTCQFGKKDRLKGIMNHTNAGNPSKLGFVMITAGFVTMQGPFRLYTLLAREVASLGITSLRFDLGGIGNSEQIHTSLTLKQRTAIDIREAINFMIANYGIKKIVLFGLCSGAEDAFWYAETDERIVGVTMIDPHSYRTKSWKFHQVFSRISINKLIRKMLKLFDPKEIEIPSDQQTNLLRNTGNLIDYQYMPHEQSSKILDRLIDRNVYIHYIYTGGARDSFNHPGQLKAMFHHIDFKGLVSLNFLPQLDHTQILHEDRELVIRAISDWLSKHFLT